MTENSASNSEQERVARSKLLSTQSEPNAGPAPYGPAQQQQSPRPRHASDEGIEDEPDHPRVNGVASLKSCLRNGSHNGGAGEERAVGGVGGLSRSGSAKGAREIKHVTLEGQESVALSGSLPSDLKLRNGHHGRYDEA